MLQVALVILLLHQAYGVLDGPYAYLAINAQARTYRNETMIRRRLEINFINCNQMNARIALYEHDPEDFVGVEPLLVLDPDEYLDDFYVTGIELPLVTSDSLGYEEKCVFPYFLRVEDAISRLPLTETRCLKMYPNWMSKSKPSLDGAKFSDLMLAFTHDSAAYKEYEGPGDDNLVTLAVFAQEESLEQQLQWGVRGLDIRVAYYPTTEEKFWLVHGIIKTHPLTVGLEQLKNFLKNSQDIIFITYGGFEQSWPDEAHEELVDLLYSQLKDWWVLPTADWFHVTLSNLWTLPYLNQGQGRVLSSYKYLPFSDPALFFQEFPYTWGDKNDPNELKMYLDEVVGVANAHPEQYNPWGPGCQMTPKAQDIIFGRWHGLRDMADAINRNVTKWWLTDPAYDMVGVYPSIDFILSSDLIHVSIEKSLSSN